MADTDYYESHFGEGVLAKVQYKEVVDDMDNSLEHEINVGCASRLLNELDESLVGLVFFETSDTNVQNQIKNHSDLVEHINTY